MISETNTAAKKNPSDDKHCKILCSPVKNNTDNEKDSGNEHGEPPAEIAGGVGGKEGCGEPRKVQRGREQLQSLVVILAVVALFILVLLTIHRREELFEKIVHRRHTTFMNKIYFFN